MAFDAFPFLSAASIEKNKPVWMACSGKSSKVTQHVDVTPERAIALAVLDACRSYQPNLKQLSLLNLR